MKKNRSKKMQRGGIFGFFEGDKPASTYAPASTYESTPTPTPASTYAPTSYWSSIKKNLPTTSSWSLFGDSQNKIPQVSQQMSPTYGGKKRTRNKTKKRKTKRRRTRRH